MANQQLFDYINQQLQQGYTKDQIVSSLAASGWQPADISAGFSVINPTSGVIPPTFGTEYSQPFNSLQKKNSHKTLIFALVTILILLIAGGVYGYFYFFQSPEMIVKRMFLNISKVKSLEYSGEFKAEAINDQANNYSLGFNGKSDTNDLNNSKSSISLTTTINTSQLPMVLGIDLISTDKVTYLQLSKADNFAFFDLSTLKNQWVKFDPEAITKQFGLQDIETKIELAQTGNQLSAEKIKELEKLLTEAQIYKITEKLPGQNIEGQNTYHYKFIFDKAEIRRVYNEISKIVQDRVLNETELKTYDDMAQNIEQPQGEIWIGQKDLLPYKLNLNFTLKSTETPTTSGIVSLDLLLKNYNKPVQIEAPTEFKTVEEILNSILNSNVPSESNPGLPLTQGNQQDILQNPDECLFASECMIGWHCFNQKCVSNEILKSQENCVLNNQPPAYSATCAQKCENCKSGVFKCWGGSTAISDIINKCVECLSDRDCKSGFSCNEYSCIKATQTCGQLKGKDCSATNTCINGDLFRTIDTDFCCTGSCG